MYKTLTHGDLIRLIRMGQFICNKIDKKSQPVYLYRFTISRLLKHNGQKRIENIANSNSVVMILAQNVINQNKKILNPCY